MPVKREEDAARTPAPRRRMDFAFPESKKAKSDDAVKFETRAFAKREGADVWSVETRPLPKGVHAYKLIVDGRWIVDADNPLDVDDGVGGRNSAFVVARLMR